MNPQWQTVFLRFLWWRSLCDPAETLTHTRTKLYLRNLSNCKRSHPLADLLLELSSWNHIYWGLLIFEILSVAMILSKTMFTLWSCRDSNPYKDKTLLMLRLLSSRAHWRKFFGKASKPCHVGIHWKALTECSQMSTHISGFQLFFRFFFIILYWPN